MSRRTDETIKSTLSPYGAMESRFRQHWLACEFPVYPKFFHFMNFHNPDIFGSRVPVGPRLTIPHRLRAAHMGMTAVFGSCVFDTDSLRMISRGHRLRVRVAHETLALRRVGHAYHRVESFTVYLQ
jgi:hypothetical protein